MDFSFKPLFENCIIFVISTCLCSDTFVYLWIFNNISVYSLSLHIFRNTIMDKYTMYISLDRCLSLIEVNEYFKCFHYTGNLVYAVNGPTSFLLPVQGMTIDPQSETVIDHWAPEEVSNCLLFLFFSVLKMSTFRVENVEK